MADLKKIDEAAMAQVIESARVYAIDTVERAALRAFAAVHDASAALAMLPKTSMDLVERAVVVATHELHVRGYEVRLNAINMSVSGGGGVDGSVVHLHDESCLPVGRYRVLHFIIPIEEPKS